ncbi:MAG: putative DNA binding domain-containing protein [Methanomassiliicoccaceae archaeon]|nr:putative DNA binding domain-containing protein [Methanomassiliicoccaceae archaeon]
MKINTNIPLRESSFIEVKAAEKGLPGSIWETYSAFCNTNGGTIVLGVSEDPVTKELTYTGVKDTDSMIKKFWDTINDPLKVNYVALNNNDVRVENAGGKEIIIIEVPRVNRRNRPVFINNNLNSGTFRRNFEGDYHCTLPEIKEMIRDSEPRTSDALILDDIALNSINIPTLESYRDSLRAKSGGHPWVKLDDEEFMELIGAAGYAADGKLHPTRAGLLMFGKEHRITNEFPYYFLDYREKYTAERWSHRIHSQSGMWSGNIFDFFTTVIERLSVIVPSPFELVGFVRKGESDAFVAAREAVMNALIHSDYYIERGLVIEMVRNIMKVSNPGTFRIPIEEAIKGGISDPRNSQIMKMFLLIGRAEHVGSGLYKIIETERSGAISYANIEESYDPSRVVVTLDFTQETERSGSAASAVMGALRSDNTLTIPALAGITGLSEKTVSRALTELKATGKIIRVGNRRSGHWEIGTGVRKDNGKKGQYEIGTYAFDVKKKNE